MYDASLKSVLANSALAFAPVVHFDPTHDKLLDFDFSINNAELTEEIFNDTRNFGEYINKKLRESNCKFGIGGYAEHRKFYSRSNIFNSNLKDGSGEDVEPRRLHLGVDIWGKANTAVMSPLDAIVHSFAFNDRVGDYGATIILTHRLQDISFYTLYGHLSLNSIKNIGAGDRIMTGDIFADFGLPTENGHWPPHLHFQIINDIGDWQGDYPGVCKISEKEIYLKNCPDPALILRMKT